MTSANVLIGVVLVLNQMGYSARIFPLGEQADSTDTYGQAVQDPKTYRHSSPTFAFDIPDGWVEYSPAPTPNVYTKLWRVVDGVFTGSGIRITGGPAGDVKAVWEINANDLRSEFEKEYAVRNYRTERVTINGRNALRFEFDSQLPDNGKTIPVKFVGHTFLVKDSAGEYLIMALLLSRVFEITADNAGYMTVVNSLKFH
jgi:hypothetical protein